MPTINWDDFETEAEEVTETDAKEIDEGPQNKFIGDCIAVVVESTPRQIGFNKYTCIGVTLKFEIEKVLKVGVKQMAVDAKSDMDYAVVLEDPSIGDQEKFTGENIYDDVAFHHPDEKDAMARRRKMVALKCGLIQPGQALVKSMWQKDIIGKRVVLHVVDNRYEDKKTKTTKAGRPQIDFFNGYDLISTVEGDQAKQSNWDDI